MLAGFATYYEAHGVGKSLKEAIREYSAAIPKRALSEDTKKHMSKWRDSVKEHFDKKKAVDSGYTWKQAMIAMSNKKK